MRVCRLKFENRFYSNLTFRNIFLGMSGHILKQK
jgi:hypothetical protein